MFIYDSNGPSQMLYFQLQFLLTGAIYISLKNVKHQADLTAVQALMNTNTAKIKEILLRNTFLLTRTISYSLRMHK